MFGRIDETPQDNFKSWALFPFLWLMVSNAGLFAAGSEMKGLVVEEVGVGSVLEKAGLENGDLLFSWKLISGSSQSGSVEGVFDSAFTWPWFLDEKAPRGKVRLVGERDGKGQTFLVDQGLWRAEIRPILPEPFAAKYNHGKSLIASGDIKAGISVWEQGLEVGLDDSWLYLKVGNAWLENKDWDRAEKAFTSALAHAGDRPIALAIVWARIAETFSKQNAFEKARNAWRQNQSIWENQSNQELGIAKALSAHGELYYSEGDFKKAHSYFEKSLSIQKKLAPGSLQLAATLNSLGLAAWDLGKLEAAMEAYSQALGIRNKLTPESSGVASCLNNLGILALDTGRLEEADYYLKQTLAMDEKLAPDSLDVAGTLNNLGNLAVSKGELNEAENYHKRGMEIRKKLDPDSINLAISYNNLGVIEKERGLLKKSFNYYHKALAIRKKLGDTDVAHIFANLGNVALARGELDLAEDYFQRALSIEEKQAPQSLSVAQSYVSLGGLAEERKELNRAESYYRRSLVIIENLTPESQEMAKILGNLGNIALTRGHFEHAMEYHKHALRIKQKQGNNSPNIAFSLNNLGDVAFKKKDFPQAHKYYKEALLIREKHTPKSLMTADSFMKLGRITMAQNERDKALSFFQSALFICRKLAPGSRVEAESLHLSATVFQQQGLHHQALEYFVAAIDTIEEQFTKLGGSHKLQANYRVNFHIYYRNAIDLLIKMERFEEAFDLLERFRARILLALLAERDLTISDEDIHIDLLQNRKRLNAEYDRVQEKMAQIGSNERGKIVELKEQLHQLSREREEIMAKVRKASPRLAAIQYPQPLDSDQTRRMLEDGTLLLTYCVNQYETYLFSLTNVGKLQCYIIPKGRDHFKENVANLLRAVQGKGSITRKVFETLSARLFADLIAPAAEEIEASRRLLIIPDGPLNGLPFGMLQQGQGTDIRYLIEWKPYSSVVSATVYGELKQYQDNNGALPRLTAFGDPVYQRNEVAQQRGKAPTPDILRHLDYLNLDRLPHSGDEVRKIATFFKDRATIYLREEASETQARQIGESDVVHFACHAIFDEELPLNSGLILTTPNRIREGDQNGVLQAWEIFESVRLKADLLVLSACETGRGRNLGGEGLIGLTRAFQYAGVRSMVASNWNVSDAVTAYFMERFYDNLRRGYTKGEALQAAQLELIHKPARVVNKGFWRWLFPLKEIDASHPYYWAAFSLIGPWD